MNNTNKGFTLIELMVVIAIIGLLSGVVLSSFNEVKKRAENTKILAEAHQLSIELQLYYDENGHYPHPVSGAGMYCIGGHNCKFAGVSVTDNLNDEELAFNFSFSEPSINNMLASTFNYSSSISDIEIDGNSGFVYHYQPDSPNPEVITFATHSLTEDTANSYSVPAQEFVEKGGLTLIGEAELDAVVEEDHNEDFSNEQEFEEAFDNWLEDHDMTVSMTVDDWTKLFVMDTGQHYEPYSEWWGEELTTELLGAYNDRVDGGESPIYDAVYDGLLDNHDQTLSQEEQDYEDFMNDHDTMESIDRDIDNGDHDQDYSDWATDHDTMESIDRDIDNGDHDQDYSDWATDHDVWESIGRDIDNGDHDQEYSNWINNNNLNSKDNPAYHETDTSNNVFLDVGVN